MSTTDLMDHTETDIRERILITTERLFREVGYQKTTVADIAKTLRMSPANVYRFFDSKKSINAAVACRLMGEVELASRTIATGKGTAAARLREMLMTVHQMNSDRYVGDSKMHEMVACAMEENWDVCQAHVGRITGEVSNVIASGAASGEFKVENVGVASLCVCSAMIKFFHPMFIADTTKPGPTLEQMIDFVITGLGGKAR